MLGVLRSNVSVGVNGLETLRLIRKRHLPGDRRDYYEAPDDVWRWSRNVAAVKPMPGAIVARNDQATV